MWGPVTEERHRLGAHADQLPPGRVEGDSPGPLPGSCTRGLRKDSAFAIEGQGDPQVNTPTTCTRLQQTHGALSPLERMYRGPLNVDELLAELHASENGPKDRAFLGAGRQCRGGEVAAPASSDVDIAMSRMQERLNRLNGEMQMQPNGPCRPGLPPRHGRRAGVAAAADVPAAQFDFVYFFDVLVHVDVHTQFRYYAQLPKVPHSRRKH